jgi:hypothetical protein
MPKNTQRETERETDRQTESGMQKHTLTLHPLHADFLASYLRGKKQGVLSRK